MTWLIFLAFHTPEGIECPKETCLDGTSHLTAHQSCDPPLDADVFSNSILDGIIASESNIISGCPLQILKDLQGT